MLTVLPPQSAGTEVYMNPQQYRLNVVEELLTIAVGNIEAKAADGKKAFNILSATHTYDAVRLLGFEDLSRKLGRVMDSLTFGDSMRGTITNIPISTHRCQEKLKFRSMDELENEYPLISFDYIRDFSRYGKHIEYCLAGTFDRAVAEAKNELDKAELAHALPLLGEFDLAKKVIVECDNRIAGFNRVLCIELFRYDQFDEAEKLLTQLRPSLGDWCFPFLAFGIAGRRPWQPYPFPDY